jgi:hypothetical protein
MSLAPPITRYDKIYLLTAIGLSSGGSSTVHIYTQTIHRTTQNKQYIEQHNIDMMNRVTFGEQQKPLSSSFLNLYSLLYFSPSRAQNSLFNGTSSGISFRNLFPSYAHTNNIQGATHSITGSTDRPTPTEALLVWFSL